MIWYNTSIAYFQEDSYSVLIYMHNLTITVVIAQLTIT